MIKKIIKNFSIITAPIAILALITYISISHLPDKIYVNESTEVSDICIQNSSILNKINVKKDKLNVDF